MGTRTGTLGQGTETLEDKGTQSHSRAQRGLSHSLIPSPAPAWNTQPSHTRTFIGCQQEPPNTPRSMGRRAPLPQILGDAGSHVSKAPMVGQKAPLGREEPPLHEATEEGGPMINNLLN